MMFIVKVLESLPLELLAFIVKVHSPLSVGVPEIVPVSASKLSPSGRVPLMLHDKGREPEAVIL